MCSEIFYSFPNTSGSTYVAVLSHTLATSGRERDGPSNGCNKAAALDEASIGGLMPQVSSFHDLYVAKDDLKRITLSRSLTHGMCTLDCM